jgi:hypothetical protein
VRRGRVELHRDLLGFEGGQTKADSGQQGKPVSGISGEVEKTFAFQKADTGGWRCNTTSLQPVEFGAARSGP